jgi:hypothetical protein
MTKRLLAQSAFAASFSILFASVSYSQVSTGPTPKGDNAAEVTAAGQAPAGSDRNAPQASAGKSAAASEGDAGMKVYIDPKTGAIVSEPPPGAPALQLSPQEQNALSTSSEGLAPVPNSVPGGGLKIDFKGRFQSPLIATTDENGKVKMEHLGETPASHEHK